MLSHNAPGMKINWNLQIVAVITLITSVFFWFLVLPADSKASRVVLVPATIVLAEGVFIFVRGFLLYRKYRILTGLPRSMIRSMALGMVEIHGKSFGEQRVVSPLSRTPCFYYRVMLKGRGRDVDRHGKSTDITYYEIDERGVPFYLQDGTGNVRVDPQGIESDLRLQFQGQAAEAGFSLLTTMLKTGAMKGPSGPSNKELMDYARSVIGRGGKISGSLSSCEVEEYCLLPDCWYDLTGTCVENPNPHDAQARNAIVKGKEEPTFLISWRSEAGIEAELRKRALLSTFGGGGLVVVSVALFLHEFGMI